MDEKYVFVCEYHWCVCFVIVGGLQRIQKANAEEFIHIFVNNSGKLTEFLEHMVEVWIILVSPENTSSYYFVFKYHLNCYHLSIANQIHSHAPTEVKQKSLTFFLPKAQP